MKKSKTMQARGRKGGKSRSRRKLAAVRRNVAKARKARLDAQRIEQAKQVLRNLVVSVDGRQSVRVFLEQPDGTFKRNPAAPKGGAK